MENTAEEKSIFNVLFENSNDGILISDFNYNVIDVNPTFEKIFGYTRKDALNTRTPTFVSENFQEILRANTQKLSNQEKLPTGEYECCTQSGKLIIVEVSSSPIEYKSKPAALSIIRDITERRKTVVALRKEKEFAENILRSMPGTFFLSKIVDNNSILVKWNEAFRRDAMMTEDELRGMNTHVFLNEKDKRRYQEIIRKVVKGEFDDMVLTTSTDATLKDGSIHKYIYKHTAFKEDGVYYVINSGIDVTDRIELERKLAESVIQTEESERKRIASDLHDGIGPELTTIKLYLQVLMNTRDNKGKKELEGKILELIDNTIDSVSEISYNISPHILLNYGVVEALESFINKLVFNKEITIITSFDNIERFGVNEELTLYRTVTELLNNTIKYSKASNAELKLKLIDGLLMVSYSDNGIGFNVYEKLEEKQGMGLQNAISRIKSLGGTIEIESKTGAGMTVEMYLPHNINHEKDQNSHS